ncbi:MAG: YihY/virulence factor BrkB family protein [Lautropia sp.]
MANERWWRKLWDLIRDTGSAWSSDYAASMGAALAYYTLFSLAPLLLIVISVAGLVFGAEEARGEVFDALSGWLGNDGAAAVRGLLSSVNTHRSGVVGTLIGFGLLVVGATTVLGELQNALDRIWRVAGADGDADAPTPRLRLRADAPGWLMLLRARLLSFGLILAIGFLLMVSLLASAALEAVGNWWTVGGWQVVARIVNQTLSFAMATGLFAFIYKFMPRVRIAWRDVWIGAVVTAALFTLGKYLIGLYVGRAGVASGYGAAGSVVVLLVWVYYSAQVFLVGAEFTWVYAHRHGSLKPAGPIHVPGPG